MAYRRIRPSRKCAQEKPESQERASRCWSLMVRHDYLRGAKKEHSAKGMPRRAQAGPPPNVVTGIVGKKRMPAKR